MNSFRVALDENSSHSTIPLVSTTRTAKLAAKFAQAPGGLSALDADNPYCWRLMGYVIDASEFGNVFRFDRLLQMVKIALI